MIQATENNLRLSNYTLMVNESNKKNINYKKCLIDKLVFIFSLLILFLIISSIIIWFYGLFSAVFNVDNGCYSSLCIKWKLSTFKITKLINDPKLFYNPTCQCNQCINTNLCECNLLKCIAIAEDNYNENNVCRVLQNYNTMGTSNFEDNISDDSKTVFFSTNDYLWDYNEIKKANMIVNSTHEFYLHNSNQYCFLKDLVEYKGKWVYFSIMGFLIITTCFILLCIVFNVVNIIIERCKRLENIENNVKVENEYTGQIEVELGNV